MNKKGFTLMEMVVVMAIISIVSLVTINGYTYRERQEMKRFSQQVGETIQVMQQKASMENATYTLSKKAQDNLEYILVVSRMEQVFCYQIPAYLEVRMGVKEIKFSQDMSPANSGTLIIAHRYLPYQIRLTVRPVTGLVTIYPLEEI